MAGKTVVNQVQLGDSGTATNNAVWQTNADGTFKLARGNAGATTQDLITVDTNGTVSMPQVSTVRVNGASGNGATNTSVRRFTTVAQSTGTAITYTQSATLGDTFTINTTGVYAIAYTDAFSASADMVISVNSNVLNANPAGLAANLILNEVTAVAAAIRATCSVTAYLTAGDIVRAQSSGTGVSRSFFTITRVA